MQKWTRKAAAVIAVICLAFGTAGVAMHKWDEMRQEKAHEELTAQVVGMSEAGTTGETMPEKKVPEVENEIDETNAIKETEYVSAIDFAVLDSQNPDVVAWIQIPGTQINYPVVQGKDNDYYLHRDLNGQKSTAGTIFLDYADRADFSSLHNVLYGHHMNNGSMFQIQGSGLFRSAFRNHSLYAGAGDSFKSPGGCLHIAGCDPPENGVCIGGRICFVYSADDSGRERVRADRGDDRAFVFICDMQL